MSQFMPETAQPAQAPATNFTPPAVDASGDIALMQRVLSAAVQNPSLMPPDFMAYVFDFIQTSRLGIPIGQVFGFDKFLSTQVTIYSSTGTSSDSHTFAGAEGARSVAGPSVTLGDMGKYVVLAGVDVTADSAVLATSFVVSGGGPTVSGGALQAISVASFAALTAATDAITLTSLFNSGPNLAGTPRTVTFANAKIIAIRYAN